MNILFISPVFSGGIGGHATMLADKLSDYGYKVKKNASTAHTNKKFEKPKFCII